MPPWDGLPFDRLVAGGIDGVRGAFVLAGLDRKGSFLRHGDWDAAGGSLQKPSRSCRIASLWAVV